MTSWPQQFPAAYKSSGPTEGPILPEKAIDQVGLQQGQSKIKVDTDHLREAARPFGSGGQIPELIQTASANVALLGGGTVAGQHGGGSTINPGTFPEAVHLKTLAKQIGTALQEIFTKMTDASAYLREALGDVATFFDANEDARAAANNAVGVQATNADGALLGRPAAGTTQISTAAPAQGTAPAPGTAAH